jgi:hypothetical protein
MVKKWDAATKPSHPYRWSLSPSDRFLRLHFQWCLAVSIFGGDATEDCRPGEKLFMDELRVHNNEIDTTDQRRAVMVQVNESERCVNTGRLRGGSGRNSHYCLDRHLNLCLVGERERSS